MDQLACLHERKRKGVVSIIHLDMEQTKITKHTIVQHPSCPCCNHYNGGDNDTTEIGEVRRYRIFKRIELTSKSLLPFLSRF
jgi:hypothetical protein